MTYDIGGTEGRFVPFDAASTLHIRHSLGVKPFTGAYLLSFDEAPFAAKGGGAVFPAGNSVTFAKLPDERELVIKNDSCSNYYINVKLFALAPREE